MIGGHDPGRSRLEIGEARRPQNRVVLAGAVLDERNVRVAPGEFLAQTVFAFEPLLKRGRIDLPVSPRRREQACKQVRIQVAPLVTRRNTGCSSLPAL
jgi:hypothetical protein